MKEDIGIIEKDNNISLKDSILAKKALKHQVEQFCFNNPGIEAKYTGYED